MVVATASGCGGEEFTSGSGSGAAGGAIGSGGAGTGGGGGGSVPSACPQPQPNAGDSCTQDGLQCSWGNDPRLFCRSRLRCFGGKWETVVTPKPWPTACTNSVDCPKAAATGACTLGATLLCAYGDKFCACSIATTNWTCSKPDPGCPPVAPNEGDKNCTGGQSCCYGIKPDAVVKAECKNGVWQYTSYSC